jgi:chromosome segregation ATPase
MLSIAVQLHDTKLVMEAQIRDELEAEYAAQQEDESRSISELENTLRRQLAQAKSDQEDLLMKVRDSQQQFQAVREGFKSTLVPMSMHNPIATIKLWHNIPLSLFFLVCFYTTEKLDKEKNRCSDLEKEKDAQQIVIEKMLEEHQYLLSQLEELQENQQSRQEWEEDRSNVLNQHQLQLSEFGLREEEYATQIHQLQNEIDEFMNERAVRDNKYEQLEDKKRSLTKKYKEKDDELRRALDDLEHLNAENAEYVRRIEVFQHASNDNEESRVKFR